MKELDQATPPSTPEVIPDPEFLRQEYSIIAGEALGLHERNDSLEFYVFAAIAAAYGFAFERNFWEADNVVLGFAIFVLIGLVCILVLRRLEVRRRIVNALRIRGQQIESHFGVKDGSAQKFHDVFELVGTRITTWKIISIFAWALDIIYTFFFWDDIYQTLSKATKSEG